MSIAKPFTFTANTYAKSSEVNANFDTVYAQVNTNISAIAQNATDIDNLENNKANINGDYSQRFAVADPTTNTDAVNKRSLMNAIGNSVDYINGLTIAKDSGSPNDTIIVSAGSCYDSTHSIVLSLSDATSKQNDNQGASTTYYVYIIGDATGATIDILISSSSTTPTLPAGYTRYRQIGYYTTDSNSHISNIGYYGNANNSDNSPNGISGYLAPDYSNGVSITLPYTATKNGYVYAGVDGLNSPKYVYVNNKPVHGHSGYSGGANTYSGSVFRVCVGDIVTCNNTMGNYYFYPIKGV